MPADKAGRPSGGALILAAGFGRRFGSDKRRYRLSDGRTLLQATLARYAEVYPEVCLVLRPGDGALASVAKGLPTRLQIAISEDAALGMGHSLAAGVRRISANWDWVSVALGDMPFVEANTLRDLLRIFESSPVGSIVQPTFNRTPGHPVTFPSSCFPDMAGLEGDQGARPVLAAHADMLIRHPVNDPGVLQDVDVPPTD